MKMRYRTLFALLFVVVFFSSATRKKLDNANVQLEEANKKNVELIEANGNLKQQVTSLTAANQKLNDEYGRYKSDCEETKQDLTEVQQELDEFNNTLTTLLEKLQQAMADFEDKGAYVYRKDGLVYVSLEDDLLFKT